VFYFKGDMLKNSEFYISVPNQDNKSVQLEGGEARFTYDYKYGRTENEIQEYVKVVPFDRGNISDMTLERFKSVIPNTYQLMRNFSNGNSKMKRHAEEIRIK